MNEEFNKTIFSFYFNFLVYLGSWVIETDSLTKKFLYFLYSNAVSAWVLFTFYMGVLDLIDSVPHINRIFYNVSINLFIVGTWIKTQDILRKSRRINFLRKKLHRSVESCKNAEEREIFDQAEGDVKLITRLFYLLLVWFYPSWLFLSLCSDYWGKREVPLPAKWPSDVDIHDLKTFTLIVSYHGSFALFYLCHALSLDASMFGLLVQIFREYRFLIKKIEEFSELCEDLDVWNDENVEKKSKVREINVFLKRARARQLLGEIIMRQQELFTFTEDFEYGYNILLFIHIFAGGMLLCVNGIQAMIVSFDFSAKMSYQFGYVMAITSDMLYLCWLTNRISTKCFEVGTAFYTTPWYKMDVGLQKDISLVILRSQKPPRITSGNFLELNLRAFMVMIKNIYSWLALFRQVAIK